MSISTGDPLVGVSVTVPVKIPLLSASSGTAARSALTETAAAAEPVVGVSSSHGMSSVIVQVWAGKPVTLNERVRSAAAGALPMLYARFEAELATPVTL